MKNLLSIIRGLSVLTLLTMFAVSCGEEENTGVGDFSLSVNETGADYVEFSVTAPETIEIAYLVSEEPQLVTPAVLFAVGKTTTVSPGDVLRIDDGIEQDRKYYFYSVARLDEMTYSEKISLEFETASYEFDELITIVDTYYDGYKAHITVPEETKERGNVIRTGSMPLAWYYLLASSGGAANVELQAIASTGNPYTGHMFRDSTIVWNDRNVVLLDENGEPVIDEFGEQYDIHDPMAPGEPTVMFAGECRYGTKDDFASVVGYYQPERDSWSVPYYDPETQEWLGAFQKKEFFTKQPDLCDATVEIDIPENEITVTDAMIYFDMSDDAYCYFYMVLDNSLYNQMLGTYLNGNEDWWQWFLTSYIAFYEWGVFPETESISINAASNFVEPLTGGNTYHVLATVFGDENGSSQRFIHKTFKAKEKTKVPPVIEVTPVPSDDPYTASFNIKAGADSKGVVQPIMGAYWVCNYSRDFEMMFNAGYTYANLLSKLGWTFTPAEIAKINSKDGLTVSFDTLDGEVTRFATYGCNDEYTFNVIDDTNNAGWADYRSPMAGGKTPVSSPLFAALEGDWTAKATVRASQQLEDESVITYNLDHTAKVTISSSAPEVPESLDESVYALYKDTDKDEVDNMFEELKERTEEFTEYRLKGQNRLLCNGFIDVDPAFAETKKNRLEYYSPYDLFVATDYNSYDISQLIYDFGPKWYLEVLPDGRVIVPFSAATMPPMLNWPGYSFYVGGVGEGFAFYEANETYPGFPVEISEDMNTITIKPIVLTDEKGASHSYYMNALGVNPQSTTGELELVSTVVTEIVLKRGWVDRKGSEEETLPAAPASRTYAKAVDVDGNPVTEMPEPAVRKSMSRFEAKPLPKYVYKEDANVITKEMVDATSQKILRKYNLL